MCGEMAGDPAYVLVLLALGLDTLSMNPADIPKVKRVIRAADVRDARKMLDEAMAFSSHDEIERYVLEQMQRRISHPLFAARQTAFETFVFHLTYLDSP